jgi:CRP-like cAMP-binding protein
MHAVEPATLIAFNERFNDGTTHWPDLRALIDQRAAERHHRAMLLGAIGHLPRVEQRVTALLWLVATEWGSVEEDGLVVPLPLTHAMIGRFVGAARSTVTLAITDLTADGLVARGEGGSWLLPAESEAVARRLLGIDGRPAAGAVRA